MKIYERKETPNKPLWDFQAGDLLYVQKMKSGFSYVYLCKFIELRKGVVVAEILEADREQDRTTGIITARASSCYAWAEMVEDGRPYCHWFRNGLDEAGR
jgi:hypothetical protein